MTGGLPGKAIASSDRKLALDVFLDGQTGVAGRLVHTGLETTFAYDPAYVGSYPRAALSISLPVQNRVYGPRDVLPFFENLLPEGKRLSVLALQLGLDERDLMGILEHVGRDCPGAVSIVPAGEHPAKTPGEFPQDYDVLDPADLLDQMEKGIDRTRAAGEGQEFSLAGVQGKAAVVMDADGRFHRARGGAPSTHIAKLPDPAFAGMVANESFCLDLARAMGLDAVEPRIVELAPGREVLVVPRYDREIEGLLPARSPRGAIMPAAAGISGPCIVRRVHQEDFCQALGFTSDRKYTHRGGPRADDLLALEKVDAFALFRINLLDAMIFNFLVANADAHAKNYALLHGRAFRAGLAPLYDVLSIALYPQYRQRMALTFGAEEGQDDQGFEDLDMQAIERAANRMGIRPSVILGRLRVAAAMILGVAEKVRSAKPKYGPVALRVMSAIGRQVELLNDAFGFGIEVDVLGFEDKPGGWRLPS